MSDLDPFREKLPPRQWIEDFCALIALPHRTADACKALIEQRHPDEPWHEEAAFRLWQAYRYLMLHEKDWIRVGLESKDGKVKKTVLFSLWLHFATVDLPHCGMMDFPVTTFIYGASRAGKDF